MGNPQHGGERSEPRVALGCEVWTAYSCLGPPQASPQTGARPGRGVPIAARTSPGPRSVKSVRVCGRRHLSEGPLIINLAVESSEWRMDNQENHRHTGGARRFRSAASYTERLQDRTPASHRY